MIYGEYVGMYFRDEWRRNTVMTSKPNPESQDVNEQKREPAKFGVRSWLVLPLGILAGFLLAYSFYLLGRALRPEPVFRGAVLNPSIPAVDFTLTGPSGQSFSLRDFRGRAILLTFGYTGSPDLTPALLNKLSQARAMLDEDMGNVQVIMITLDPARDTPEQLEKFMGQVDDSFIGLTGAADTIRDVANSYDVYFAPAMETTPLNNREALTAPVYTPIVLLVDSQGWWQAVYPLSTSAEDIAADLRMLIK